MRQLTLAAFLLCTLPILSTAQLTVSPGTTLSIPSSSNSTVWVAGTLMNSGTITGDGRVVLNGNNAQSISGNGSISNLELDNGSGANIISGSQTVTDTYFPTTGTLTTNDSLILESTATGTARIAQGSNNYISGAVIVQRYIPAQRGYRLFAHPFSSGINLSQLTENMDISGNGGASNGFTPTPTNNPSAFWHDPALSTGTSSAAWQAYTTTYGGSAPNVWDDGEGLLLFIRGSKGQGIGGGVYTPNDVLLDVSGTPNMGAQTATLVKPVGASGWNLVGNPYPSQIDVAAVGSVLNSAVLGNSIVVYNPQGQPGNSYTMRGAYEIKTINDGSDNPLSFVLPAFSSFFIKTAVDGYVLNFNESCKTSTAPVSTLFKTTTVSDRVRLELTDSNERWDDLMICMDSTSGSTSTDVRDINKFRNDRLDFYTVSTDGVRLAHDYRSTSSLANSNHIIPLGVRSMVQGNFLLKVVELNLGTLTGIQFEDLYTNTIIPLTGNFSYPFTISSDTDSQGSARFRLVFQPLSIEETDNDERISIYPNPASENLWIHIPEAGRSGTSVGVYDLYGRPLVQMKPGSVHGGDLRVDISKYPPGSYLVEVVYDGKRSIRRFVKL